MSTDTPTDTPTDTLRNTLKSHSTHVVNLERRADRMAKFKYPLPYKRFDAIDGNSIHFNDVLNKIFSLKLLPRPAMGCALSHIILWNRLINSNDEYMVILEDDIF